MPLICHFVEGTGYCDQDLSSVWFHIGITEVKSSCSFQMQIKRFVGVNSLQ